MLYVRSQNLVSKECNEVGQTSHYFPSISFGNFAYAVELNPELASCVNGVVFHLSYRVLFLVSHKLLKRISNNASSSSITIGFVMNIVGKARCVWYFITTHTCSVYTTPQVHKLVSSTLTMKKNCLR